MKNFQTVCLLASLLLMMSCGTSKFVRPLEKSEHRVQFSAAGPLTMPGNSKIPLPYPAIAYGYGVSNDLTAYGSFHPLLSVFYSAGLETGAVYRFFHQEDIGVDLVADGKLFFVMNSDTLLVFPSIGFTGSRAYYSWLFYAGLDFMFHPYTGRVYLPYLYVPSLGLEKEFAESWTVGFEVKWASISTKTEYQDIEDPSGISPKSGVFMPFLRISYDF